MDISRAGSPTAASAGSAISSSDNTNVLMGGVGKSDFLKLLIAQLRNQDPMKPMEDKEFISQMAQLNTVEQIMAMNTKMDALLTFEAISQASSLIGKTIEAQSEGGSPIRGIVQEVRFEQGVPLLMVDGHKIWLEDVQRIVPAA